MEQVMDRTLAQLHKGETATITGFTRKPCP